MNENFIEQSAEIICAYVVNNHVAIGDLPALIQSVLTTLNSLNGAGIAPEKTDPLPQNLTAAQIRKSVTPDALISFIDGRGYKTLKRHLTAHGFDPTSYRAHFGLPVDYPMVAASYSETRSGLARSLGLGQRGGREYAA